jgi:hypothetical protein
VIRLLRIELRHNTLLLLLPVVALLWLSSPIARHLQPMALWPDRSADIQSALQALCPFTAGVAAWTAYRERRRGATDLLTTTPRNAGQRALTALAATTIWAVVGYLAGAAVMLVVTAYQATWGHPVPWPLLIGLLAVITAAAVGFAAGRLVPSRFTAPLTAIGVLGLLALAAETGFHHSMYGRLGPLYPAVNLTLSVFYPVRTGLAVVQAMMLGGVLATALALTLLHTGNRRTGLTAVVVGALLAGTSVVLVGTAHEDAQRAVVVPALDHVDVQRPLPYTPVCGTSALPVCVHPAYAATLSVVDKSVNALVRPLLGTPGAPVRASEAPMETILDVTMRGVPPELAIPPIFVQGETLGPDAVARTYQTVMALALVDRPGTHPRHATDAQRAVALYLLHQAGVRADSFLLPASPAVRAAADRLAAMSGADRHAWLTAHIAEVRAGALTVRELP